MTASDAHYTSDERNAQQKRKKKRKAIQKRRDRLLLEVTFSQLKHLITLMYSANNRFGAFGMGVAYKQLSEVLFVHQPDQ